MENYLKIALSVFFSLCLFTLSSHADTFPDAQAIATAEAFVTTIDNDSYQAAYMSGSELLRLATDENDWIESTELSRKMFGPVLERNIKAARTVTNYPGLPDGNYLLIYYEVRAERKKKAAEMVLVEQTNTAWAVCFYSIR